MLSALIENVAVGAKEMRALGLDVYVLFATSVVLVSGYGAAKNLHVLFCKMLASSRKNTASTKFGFLQEMSLLAHLSISAALFGCCSGARTRVFDRLQVYYFY